MDPFCRRAAGIPGCWLHDPLAVVAVVDRGVLGTERMVVGVELRGELTYGQTLARRDGGGGIRPPRGRTVDVAVTVDIPRFMGHFLPGLTAVLS